MNTLIRMLFLGSVLHFSQFTIAQVAAVKLVVHVPLPDTTSREVFVAGSFNCWNSGDTFYRMRKEREGVYSRVIPVYANHSYVYKYTLGSWDYVEITLGDSNIQNRKFLAADQLEVNDTVRKWRYPVAVKYELNPQLEKINDRKNLGKEDINKELEELKGLFRPYVENLLEERPSKTVYKRINRKAVRKIGKAYDRLAQGFWDVFALFTPEQKAKIRQMISESSVDTDIFDTVGNAINKVVGEN